MSTLVAHNPRFAAQFVSREQLAVLPAPAQLGRWHNPIPHIELVDAILGEAFNRGMRPIKEQFALGGKGHALFGVLDFTGKSDRAMSLGFRNSTDQSLALQGVAGSHVFVCDNLALSGEFKAWSRKNTLHANLFQVVRDGFDMFCEQARTFEHSIERLANTHVSDDRAKAVMWDVFSGDILPARLLGEAHTNYFAPKQDWTDITEHRSTEWGLHNALTRVARQLAPSRLMDATTALGRVFDIA